MINRREFVLGTTLAVTSGIAGCSALPDSVSEPFTGPSVEEIKEESETVEYDELYRNISEYEGEYVHYEQLRLSHVVEGEDSKEYLLTFPDGEFNDDRIFYALWDGDPFQEGDEVEVWGIVQGLRTYTSMTGERTVVEIELVDMNLIE